MTEENIFVIRCFIEGDNRSTVSYIASGVGISYRSAQVIMVRWVT